MATEAPTGLKIDPSLVGTLELEGFEVPYVNLQGQPFVHTRLLVGGTEYAYDRTYPITGHSAVMPGAIAGLQAEGRQVLVAERTERYYVYLA